jgi:hypothetical protein
MVLSLQETWRQRANIRHVVMRARTGSAETIFGGDWAGLPSFQRSKPDGVWTPLPNHSHASLEIRRYWKLGRERIPGDLDLWFDLSHRASVKVLAGWRSKFQSHAPPGTALPS